MRHVLSHAAAVSCEIQLLKVLITAEDHDIDARCKPFEPGQHTVGWPAPDQVWNVAATYSTEHASQIPPDLFADRNFQMRSFSENADRHLVRLGPSRVPLEVYLVGVLTAGRVWIGPCRSAGGAATCY
jgi:hypothetical protein